MDRGLGVIAKEHDEGTPDEAAEKARRIAESLVSKVEEAASALAMGDTGSFVTPEWAREIFVGWIPEAAAAVLGLGDDDVGSNGKILFDYSPTADEWKTPEKIGDFGANPYNVSFPVGVNPEEGRYEVFFNVKVAKDETGPVVK